jgi:hypothetical protein
MALITCANRIASNCFAISFGDFPANSRRVSSPEGVCGTNTEAAEIGSPMMALHTGPRVRAGFPAARREEAKAEA